ncbi:Nuclear ribonuclease Z [Monoraphidium neglectum]|uniref:Nuclear ribonuclease Z n=1 Tax=Monoraphidium neglectum TaxID=145388 RepID=A0A0D2N2Y8_9CHLO|nr:Nuclear ribonuclease Z [Monoraphidium neglectum]KIZ00521.1 Nuclear ribonuclease Z [Monoraphidium neglectum]|eukprot:XP_013899540.1 Nuclear ribonuclease Z [Monoraphidium neglectum]
MQGFSRLVDKVKDKAAEIRAEIAEAAAAPALGPASSSAGGASASAVGQLVSQQLDTPEAAQAAGARQLGLHLCGHDVEGVSIAGQNNTRPASLHPPAPRSFQATLAAAAPACVQETCIILPRLRVAFDVGRCPQLLGMDPARYVVHPHYVDRLHQLLALCKDLEGGSPPLMYDITPLQTGEEITLPSGHIGYLLYSYRKKLKAELVGRSQEEIRALRAAGQEVTDTYQIPEVAFTGDTSGALFEDPATPADLYRAKLLIVELTFVDETVSFEQARERGHMHVADLVAHAHKFHNEAILLIHFSARYTRAQILAALEANMPPSLRSKCVPFLNGFA